MPIFDNGILLKVENLVSGYGKRQVLFDVSLQVQRAEIVLLIGGNGSGKSTLLKAIYGLLHGYENTKGQISFEGKDITKCKPFEMIRQGLVYVPQKNNTFDQLTVIENLQLVAHNMPNKEERESVVDDIFEKLPQLTMLKSRTPFHLSGGEKQLLALGMAMIQQPKMIMLDEPGAGLAPKAWFKNLEIIKSLNQQGITFLIVEHMVKEAVNIAHKVFQMKLGRIQNITINS
jgi:ABC-type branched-subunit amino acid transport system ATPase component